MAGRGLDEIHVINAFMSHRYLDGRTKRDMAAGNEACQTNNRLMARTPQSHGLPSPPARSPCNIRTSIPRTFVPHLPKLGTAKHRLRYNVFGMLAYLFIWRQGSIYASAKRALALCLATIVEGNSALWAMSSVGTLVCLFKY